jgi:hypothetical protein
MALPTQTPVFQYSLHNIAVSVSVGCPEVSGQGPNRVVLRRK